MRHAADAILSGVGTVLSDNPWLTDRSNLPRRRPLLRVVLDSTLRTPLDSKLVTTAHDDLLIVFVRGTAASQRALEERGVHLQQIRAVDRDGRVPLSELMKHLAEREITSLLVEAGSEVNAAVLNQDLADKLVLFFAPMFLGPDAVPMLSSPPPPRRSEVTLNTFGEDFAFEGYLHDPWKEITGRE